MAEKAIDTIHGENYAVLAVAILSQRYLTPERAWGVYEDGPGKPAKREKSRERLAEITFMRERGRSWSEIAEELGFKNKNSAMSYWSHRKHMMKYSGGDKNV